MDIDLSNDVLIWKIFMYFTYKGCFRYMAYCEAYFRMNALFILYLLFMNR